MTLFGLLGALAAPGIGAWAQEPITTPAAAASTPPAAAECPAPDSAAFAATESSDSPYYDYVVLLDVSLSMEGKGGVGWKTPGKLKS